jgi:hypothetical protein
MSTSDSRLKIAMFQYEVARVEANQTRHDQQSIINWNQAFAVALFAAGIIAIKELDDVRVPQLLFGFVLPAVLVGGTMAWAGEMIRMERTAVFLRALERSVWRSTPDDESKSAWFVWENFLWSPPQEFQKAGYGKQSAGYAGIAIFYAAIYIASLFVFAFVSPWQFTVVVAVGLTAISAALIVPMARRVFSLGGFASNITDDDMREWADGLIKGEKVAEPSKSITNGESRRPNDAPTD